MKVREASNEGHEFKPIGKQDYISYDLQVTFYKYATNKWRYLPQEDQSSKLPKHKQDIFSFIKQRAFVV